MKTIVVIPTYNEAVNIVSLIKEIQKLNCRELEIVVVDDNSPDGTWKLVEQLQKRTKEFISFVEIIKGKRKCGH